MIVRQAAPEDLDAWAAMRAALWPDADAIELRAEAERFFRGDRGQLCAVFLCEGRARDAVGMLELSLRPYADGCRASPVPYVEGWYVASGARRQGVGRALMAAAERWAVAQGYDEIASDALIENRTSEQAHKALGFDEVERAIHFRKALRRKWKRGG